MKCEKRRFYSESYIKRDGGRDQSFGEGSVKICIEMEQGSEIENYCDTQ